MDVFKHIDRQFLCSFYHSHHGIFLPESVFRSGAGDDSTALLQSMLNDTNKALDTLAEGLANLK
jgi:hypothetical protein